MRAVPVRATALTDALDRHLGGRIDWRPPEGGMFCWARLHDVDTSNLLPAAVDQGVAFVPGRAFAVSDDLGEYLRLSFATLPPAELDEASDDSRRRWTTSDRLWSAVRPTPLHRGYYSFRVKDMNEYDPSRSSG